MWLQQTGGNVRFSQHGDAQPYVSGGAGDPAIDANCLEIAFSHQAGGAQAHDQRIRESGFSLTARKTGKWLCDKALGFERRPTKPHRLQSIPEYERSEYKVTL
jgi:hypothetical protein